MLTRSQQVSLNSLIVDGSAPVSLRQSASAIETRDERVGETGTGAVYLSGFPSDATTTHRVTNALTLGFGAGSNGAYTVQSNSALSVGNEFSIGREGVGSVAIDTGGVVNVDQNTYIGRLAGSSGSVLVGDQGSFSTTNLYLGGNAAAGGSGSVTVNPGANLNVSGDLKIWSNGRLNLAGGTLTTGVFENSVNFNFTDGLLRVLNGSFSTPGSSFTLDGTTAGGAPTLLLDNSTAAVTAAVNVGLSNQSQLRLANGATLTDTSGYIGRGSGSSGRVTVDGAGSRWSNSSLFVGSLGDGGLTISNGGQVTNASGYLASGSAASGNVTVTGAGSLWDNSSTLYLGHGGRGTVNLSDAAQLNSRSAFVGNQSTGVGSVTVDNARWDSSALYLGYNGSASLQALNGGVVTGFTTYLGRFTGSSGAVNVGGSGSQLAVGNSLYVGYEGAGTLGVDNGGAVSASNAYLAFKPGATADVSLSGGSLNVSGGLYLGGGSSAAGGTATLTVNAGATATAGTSLKIWNGGTLNLAGGSVTTRLFDNAGTFNFNDGLLQVVNGSYNTPGSTLILDGAAAGDAPTLTLDNSTASSTGAAYVGYDRQANLNLRNGAVLNSTSGFVALTSSGAKGSVSVDGAGSGWNLSGNLFVGRSGNGTLNVVNGGAVSAADATLGRLAGSAGTLALRGAGSKLSATNLYIGHAGIGSAVIDGGKLSADVVSLGHDAGARGELTVYSGTLNSGTDVYLGGSAAGAGGTGRLTLNGGDATVGGLVKLYTDGRLAIDGGTLTTDSFDSSAGTLDFYKGILTVNNGNFNAGSVQLNPFPGDTLAATLALRGATGTASDLQLFGLSTVDITNGAGLISGSAGIGEVATLGRAPFLIYRSADAAVRVDGVGSSWDSGTLYVSRRNTPATASDTLSSGRLDVTNGARVSSADVYLGDGHKTQATVLVDNADWTTGDIRLGASSGRADVQVSNGGLVRSANIFSTSTSASTLSVSGAASRWINSGVLSLTKDALNIAGGARVSSPTTYLGLDGTASVDGSGSLFSSDNIYVGGSASAAGGTASLSVSNGGEANIAQTLKIWDRGDVSLSGGNIRAQTVDNAGKLRLHNGNLFVTNGSFASGGGTTSGGVFDTANSALVIAGLVRGNNPILTLTNTVATISGDLYAGTSGGVGRIVASSGSSLSSNFVNLGYDAGSIGTLSLSGPTTTATSGGWTVGDAGTGSLSASDGATVNADGDTAIGNTAGGLGLISLSGSGTRLTTNSFDLSVGRAGRGELRIRSGAQATGNAAQIAALAGASGTVTVDGAGSAWNLGSGLDVGVGGTGSLRVSNGAQATSATAQLGGADGNGTGTVRVEGVGSRWSPGTLDINNGALTVTAGAQVRPSSLSVGGASNSTATVTVSGAGSALNSTSLVVLGAATGARATLGIDNGAAVTVGGSLLHGAGSATVTLADGSLTVSDETDVNNFALNGGRLRTATLRTAGNQFDFTGGTLSADTVIGDLINQGGDLAPGNSPGATSISGDYTQSAAGIFSVEIGGLLAGSEYDVLNVSGQASLAGLLKVDWFDSGSGPFSPTAGDHFDVLSANTLSGQFDTLDLALLAGGLEWQVNYLLDEFGSTDVLRLSVVSAVPVPAAVWLFASGMIGLAAVARRRRGG